MPLPHSCSLIANLGQVGPVSAGVLDSRTVFLSSVSGFCWESYEWEWDHTFTLDPVEGYAVIISKHTNSLCPFGGFSGFPGCHSNIRFVYLDACRKSICCRYEMNLPTKVVPKMFNRDWFLDFFFERMTLDPYVKGGYTINAPEKNTDTFWPFFSGREAIHPCAKETLIDDTERGHLVP